MLNSLYHFLWAFWSALICGFPSRKIFVVGVTGTKGKTTTTELIAAIFEAAGRKTAVLNSYRMKMNGDADLNRSGMSMPGRGAIQRFLRRAARAAAASWPFWKSLRRAFFSTGIGLSASARPFSSISTPNTLRRTVLLKNTVKPSLISSVAPVRGAFLSSTATTETRSFFKSGRRRKGCFVFQKRFAGVRPVRLFTKRF